MHARGQTPRVSETLGVFSASPALHRRATGNREPTRMGANLPQPAGFAPPPSLRPPPLRAERGNEGVRSACPRGQTPRVSETLGVFSASPALHRRATGNRESTRMGANLPQPAGLRTSPQPSASPSPRAERGNEGVRSARTRGARPQGSRRPLGSSVPARRFTVGRQVTANPREWTRICPQPAGLRTSPPAFGLRLSARGEGERGGEVGMPARGQTPRVSETLGVFSASPALHRRA